MSNFQVKFGPDANGDYTMQRIPVYYGDSSRQASAILKGNSENTLSAVPAMAFYITELRYDRNRIQEPFHVSKLNLRQKSYDPVTGAYGTTQDSAYTVERMMPVPYTLGINLDVWSSNTQQKLQIVQQIVLPFNPSLEIQSTDNYIDWTSLSRVELMSTRWTSRTVPMGADESIDIFTLTFELPIWLSAPAKVQQLGVVQRMIASVFDGNGQLSEDVFLENNLMSRQQLTPLGYGVIFSGNALSLVKRNELTDSLDNKIGTPDYWHTLLDLYGNLVAGVTQVRLSLDTQYDEVSGTTSRLEIIGTVAYHPSDDTQLLFTVDPDTLPANTATPVNGIIEPQQIKVTSAFINPSLGDRYLILEAIGQQGSSSEIWGQLIAHANDIIEWDGTSWQVSLDSLTHDQVEYVTNLNSNLQYRWDHQTGGWVKSVQGLYREGTWSIIL
jgi:hypothetical protein